MQELVGQIGTLNDMDISPPENETADDFMFPDDLDDLDSDAENELLEDTISIVSTPKPSLRCCVVMILHVCIIIYHTCQNSNMLIGWEFTNIS